MRRQSEITEFDLGLRRKKNSVNVFPISIEFSADMVTPVAAFGRLLGRGEQAFFLESVEGGDRIARYTFIGINPFAVFKIRGSRLIERRNGMERIHVGNPLAKMVRLLSQFRSKPSENLPPFTGGAVGYLGFDCVQYLEEKLRPTRPPSHTDEAELMVFKNVIAFDRLKDRVIVICNILADEEPVDAGAKRALSEAEQLADFVRTPLGEEKSIRLGSGQMLTQALGNTGRNKFEKAVREVKKHIRSGEIFQCVLSEKFSQRIDASPLTIYRALRSLCPSPYMFYLKMDSGTLLGASPEMLVKVDGKKNVYTCPIAGTRPRGKTESTDRSYERELLQSSKENAEHLMLVDLGRNDIGKISLPGTVQVEAFREIHRYSHVMHMVSRVKGKLNRNLSSWEALFSCFPAGTLSGAPKIRATQILKELEVESRGPYGGAIVYSDFSGRMDSCITIRSAFIKDRTAYFQAGAGIVADSRPEKEYEEILHKSQSVRQAIALAEAAI